MLKNLDIKPPYIIVAHSYGAMYAGYFTLKNPGLVNGLLLIDPVPRDFNFSINLQNKYKQGLAEAKIKPAKYIYKKYTGSKAEVIYQLLGFEKSKDLMRKLDIIDKRIPVVIISSTGMEEKHPLREDWYNSQKQWLNNNPNSKIIRLSGGHFIQLEKPKRVCKELNKIVNLSYVRMLN